jgi:hypothetical protein
MLHVIKGGQKLVILLPWWLCIICQERYFISWPGVLSELNKIIKSKWALGPTEA